MVRPAVDSRQIPIMIVRPRLDERMHDLDRTGHPVVVFVVGFRVLTSDSRRAIRRLSERLGITPVRWNR